MASPVVIGVIVVVALILLLGGAGLLYYFFVYKKSSSGGGGSKTLGPDSFAVLGDADPNGKANYDLGQFIQTVYDEGSSNAASYTSMMSSVLQRDSDAFACNDSSTPKLNFADAKCLSFWANVFVQHPDETNDCASVGTLFRQALSTGACQPLVG